MKVDIDIKPEYKELTVVVGHHQLDGQVTDLMKRLESPLDLRITCKGEDEVILIPGEDIVYCSSESKKVMVHTSYGSYMSQDRLYELEEKLHHQGFVRLSKFAIANKKSIKKLEVTFNGSLLAHMDHGFSDIISRRQITTVKQSLGLGGKS